MRKPFITIITTTYNQEKFIRQCIGSVLNQTYKKWEMIIVDDYSNDNTARIIKQYAKKNHSIKAIYHKYNWGIKKIADSYNQALKIAQGKYIYILEGDDYWPTYKLERQARMHSKKSVLSYGNCWITNQSGDIINLYINSNSSHPTYYTPTLSINKSSLKQIGGFQKSNGYPFWDIPTIAKLQDVGNIQYINEIFGVYRKHFQSNWLKYSYSQTTCKWTLLLKKMYYWIAFNMPYVFLPRIIIKYSLYLTKKYILKECQMILNIM
jgi:glycosyltransferase involved in cell wall biosynthesis